MRARAVQQRHPPGAAAVQAISELRRQFQPGRPAADDDDVVIRLVAGSHLGKGGVVWLIRHGNVPCEAPTARRDAARPVQAPLHYGTIVAPVAAPS